MTNAVQNLGFPQPPGFWYDGAWRSGDQITLDITDPGLLYGATLFSTLRMYDGLDDPRTAWRAHRSRLSQSLKSFDWVMPDWARVELGVQQVAAGYPVVRVTLFPDGREWIMGRALPQDLIQRQQQGITAWVMDQAVGARSLPQHKTGNYLTPWFGLQNAQAQGAQETILVDAQGNWRETCTGSLWGWSDGIWYTPTLQSGILPGITRDRLIQGFRCHNKKVLECAWDQRLIGRFTIVAYSNCVVEVVPIRTILRKSETLKYQFQSDVLQELFAALVSGHSQMS
ncbi:aminotransferase class IV [filamentous cyanobacterium LEGE 11480]|uniref:Aminotransferase class IV n=1 Tax=Romeriopsis navalis LEGE 11480 TaxID=2777977 RepID=A0A928VLN3_9CYAN|nr:aminotransferase class IV [Romeriopsis navalis]MBE9028657.1 aminotransferase class IV [Romeriopsis navalis LEGE 11480]